MLDNGHHYAGGEVLVTLQHVDIIVLNYGSFEETRCHSCEGGLGKSGGIQHGGAAAMIGTLLGSQNVGRLLTHILSSFG